MSCLTRVEKSLPARLFLNLTLYSRKLKFISSRLTLHSFCLVHIFNKRRETSQCLKGRNPCPEWSPKWEYTSRKTVILQRREPRTNIDLLCLSCHDISYYVTYFATIFSGLYSSGGRIEPECLLSTHFSSHFWVAVAP